MLYDVTIIITNDIIIGVKVCVCDVTFVLINPLLYNLSE